MGGERKDSERERDIHRDMERERERRRVREGKNMNHVAWIKQ